MPATPNVDRVIADARADGLIPASDRDGRVSVLVHITLLDAAKKRTWLTSETALLDYALAKVALEDDFGDCFARLRGSVSKDVELGF